MKKYVILFLLMLSPYFIFSKHLTSVSTSGANCSQGSKINGWAVTWTYDEKGRPFSGAGVDCAGNSWAKNLNEIFHGKEPDEDLKILTWIVSIDPSHLTVRSNKEVIFRIIGIQDAKWYSELKTYSVTDKDMPVDISNLSPGLYGLLVIYNDYPIQMLNFIK